MDVCLGHTPIFRVEGFWCELTLKRLVLAVLLRVLLCANKGSDVIDTLYTQFTVFACIMRCYLGTPFICARRRKLTVCEW
jgi:hypothetical protein